MKKSTLQIKTKLLFYHLLSVLQIASKSNHMNQLPKWMDLTTQERHKLLGELIDAMIYSGEAVNYLSTSVEQFRAMGWVRSVIMPDAIEQPCPDCDGAGCDECVIILNNESKTKQ